MSSKEIKHLSKSAEKNDQSIKDPLESDLNSLFQNEEDLFIKKQASLFTSQALFFLIRNMCIHITKENNLRARDKRALP